MRDLIVTAVGEDRPGIVAGVTAEFFRLGCNLADCSMTRLSRQFAMILLVQAPDEVTGGRLEQELKEPAGRLGLDIHVIDRPHASTPIAARPFVISLYGADHPGIVYRTAQMLAAEGVNITDLVSRVVGDNIFTMLLEIDLPEALDESRLEEQLRSLSVELGVELTLRPAETADL